MEVFWRFGTRTIIKKLLRVGHDVPILMRWCVRASSGTRSTLPLSARLPSPPAGRGPPAYPASPAGGRPRPARQTGGVSPA
eukprot:806445-Pyramimonas_sp.AAC.1